MNNDILTDLNRRDFLRGGSVAAFLSMLGGVPILAAEDQPAGNNSKSRVMPPMQPRRR